jgi:PAS domain S-box-containing protein
MTTANAKFLTNHQRFLAEEDMIVTKTDTRGIITYTNDVFLNISMLTEKNALGKPHNLIRHPHMPKAVFKLLWDTLNRGEEIFAYVMNRAMNGDHYWVFAHATPSFAPNGTVIGYNSFRRAPSMEVVQKVIAPFYAGMLEEESRHANAQDAMAASTKMLLSLLESKGMSYAQFIFSLQN